LVSLPQTHNMRSYATLCAKTIWHEEGMMENFLIPNSCGLTRNWGRIPLCDSYDKEAVEAITSKLYF
jgi:hypothetical protein